MTEETASGATRQRRKRKWDQPAEAVVSAAAAATAAMPGLLPFTAGAFAGMGALPVVFPSYLNYFPALPTNVLQSGPTPAHSSSATVQHSAAAIVQKLNQDLASKGLLLQAKIQDELIAREITINDAEPGVRYKLTKRQTQEEIQLKTGAVVITRGRYRPPNGPVEPEKPLYLHISAGVNLKDTSERIKAVDQAAAMVEEMLKQGQQIQLPLRSSLSGTAFNGNVPTSATVNIFVGFEADPSFNLIGRIRGPNDQYINHIMNETGATVTLRGRGLGVKEGPSGEESPQPLHLLISSDNSKSLEEAKTLAENLLETIRSDSFPFRLPPYQVLPSPVSTVPMAALTSHPTPQQSLYQVSAASPLQSSYKGYFTSAGVYPPPYTTSQAPFPPFSPSVMASVEQPAATQTSLTNPYPTVSSSTKVYSAVPPPIELSRDQLTEKTGEPTEGSPEEQPHVRLTERMSESYASDSALNAPSPSTQPMSNSTSNRPQRSISLTGHTPLPTPYMTSQFLQQHFNGPSPVPGAASQVLQTSQTVIPPQSVLRSYSQAVGSIHVQAPMATSYGGYSGVYSEVSSVQQVAQTLQRPPLPVTVKPQPNSAFLATLTKAQFSSFQEKHSDKQPAQRRKFQEFPVSCKDSSGDDQQGRRGMISFGPDSFTPLQALGASSTKILPSPPPRIPLPPPKNIPLPKFFSSAASTRMTPPPSLQQQASTSRSVGAGHKQLEDNAARHGTGPKLVEYGEEEESSTGLAPSAQSKPFSNGKPFWAA